jgi:hypothetical protein
MWKFILLAFAGIASRLAEGAASDSYCVSPSIGTRAGAGNCLDGDIFLRGQYVEVGIHNVGSFGTSQLAPSGFVYAGRKLGFIADYDKNGFFSTSPGYAGDYFVPGAPVEGNNLSNFSCDDSTNIAQIFRFFVAVDKLRHHIQLHDGRVNGTVRHSPNHFPNHIH